MAKNIIYDYKIYLLREYMIEDQQYSKLLDRLFDTPFVAILSSDINRVDDGLYLRTEYPRRISEVLQEYPCSVLEVLIALAKRMDIEYVGTPGLDRTHDIFYLFLDNLGLLYYNNRRYREREVYDILDTWMRRKFLSNGEGSIFPLHRCIRDQRNNSIWSQMQSYIIENY